MPVYTNGGLVTMTIEEIETVLNAMPKKVDFDGMVNVIANLLMCYGMEDEWPEVMFTVGTAIDGAKKLRPDYVPDGEPMH